MRILNVNDMLDPVTGGGTAERTFQMSRALAKAGATCMVLTTDAGLTPERISALGAIEVTVCPCIWRRFVVPRISYRNIRALVERADIVHLMGHWSVLNAIVYLIASRMKKPYAVCPAGALPVYGRSKLLKRIYNWLVGYRLIRNATYCIAVTPAEVPHFERYGVPPTKVYVIPNGIALEDVPAPDPSSFRAKFGLGAAPAIVFVGRLNPIKGPDLLLEAFCNVKDALAGYQLVFVGPDGGMLAALQETARRRGVAEWVRFLGFVGGAEKYQAYCAAALLAIPSRQEAMSIVVLEAGVTGTPVLLTDQCGLPEVATCGGGEIVEASVAGLERGLLSMLRDPAGLARMGAALKAHVGKTYLWDNLAPRYLALYRRCSCGPAVR
jgi:glycosyltransferase involved in cell wall biosynthesis